MKTVLDTVNFIDFKPFFSLQIFPNGSSKSELVWFIVFEEALWSWLMTLQQWYIELLDISDRFKLVQKVKWKVNRTLVLVRITITIECF